MGETAVGNASGAGAELESIHAARLERRSIRYARASDGVVAMLACDGGSSTASTTTSEASIICDTLLLSSRGGM